MADEASLADELIAVLRNVDSSVLKTNSNLRDLNIEEIISEVRKLGSFQLKFSRLIYHSSNGRGHCVIFSRFGCYLGSTSIGSSSPNRIRTWNHHREASNTR